jgi:nicotinamide-nucleotide amidase
MKSAVEERVAPVYAKWPEHSFTILASVGEVQLHLWRTGSDEDARAVLDAQTAEFEAALPGRIFGRDAETLEGVVGNLLRERGATIATAESCTGGLIAARLTDVPGSSDYFLGGIVAYANDVKSGGLGVVPAARHARRRFGGDRDRDGGRRAARFAADWAISATGIAGPGGRHAGKAGRHGLDRRGRSRRRARPPPASPVIARHRGWSVAAALELPAKRCQAPPRRPLEGMMRELSSFSPI